MGVRGGLLPISTVSNIEAFLGTEGDATRKYPYDELKKDFVGDETLPTGKQTIRGAVAELFQNILESTGYGVVSGSPVAAQSAPNMTVNVPSNTLELQSGVRIVSVSNSALAINVSDTVNPRKDIVFIDTDFIIKYIAGVAAATPVVPSTPVGAFLLSEINVLANATTITNANIVDKRKMKNTTDLLATQLSDRMKIPGVVDDTGTANTYIIAPNPVITAYAKYQTFKFIAKTANTGASTLNVNGLGVKALVKDVNVALATGDILAGQVVEAIFDGTNFQIVNLNYKTQLSNKVDKASIVNNLTTTVVGSVLDATQGKALAERVVMYAPYPSFVNGVATITLAGITTSSIVMAQWTHGSPHYIFGVSCTTDTITLTTDSSITGVADVKLLVQK